MLPELMIIFVAIIGILAISFILASFMPVPEDILADNKEDAAVEFWRGQYHRANKEAADWNSLYVSLLKDTVGYREGI